MIVLDTNVISEVIYPERDNPVRMWLRRVYGSELALTAAVAAELLTGVAILPEGRRRRDLTEKIETALSDVPILPFDFASARHYATIIATRKRAGRPIKPFDAQIAATAWAHGAAVATRNTADFQDCGIEIINPWGFRP